MTGMKMYIIGQEGLEQIRVFKRQRTSLQQLVEAIAVFCVCEILKKTQHIHMILALVQITRLFLGF